MATKKTEAARPVLRRKPKKRASTKPKRHPWTREDGEIHGLGSKLGYARVSTLDQNLALQQDALKEAGCVKIFIEQTSGAVMERPPSLRRLSTPEAATSSLSGNSTGWRVP